MKTRNIKPGFWRDKVIHRANADTALFYVALWNMSDDEGRGVADADEMALDLPRWKAGEIEVMLNWLSKEERVLLYEVGGVRYWYAHFFYRHQYLCKPVASILPEPPCDWKAEKGDKKQRFLVDEAVDKIPYRDIVKAWNEMAKRTLPNVVFAHTDDRLLLLKDAWNRKPERKDIKWWVGYFARIGASDFLSGRSAGSNFKANFKWSLTPTFMDRILDGNYDNTPKKKGGKAKQKKAAPRARPPKDDSNEGNRLLDTYVAGLPQVDIDAMKTQAALNVSEKMPGLQPSSRAMLTGIEFKRLARARLEGADEAHEVCGAVLDSGLAAGGRGK